MKTNSQGEILFYRKDRFVILALLIFFIIPLWASVFYFQDITIKIIFVVCLFCLSGILISLCLPKPAFILSGNRIEFKDDWGKSIKVSRSQIRSIAYDYDFIRGRYLYLIFRIKGNSHKFNLLSLSLKDRIYLEQCLKDKGFYCQIFNLDQLDQKETKKIKILRSEEISDNEFFYNYSGEKYHFAIKLFVIIALLFLIITTIKIDCLK